METYNISVIDITYTSEFIPAGSLTFAKQNGAAGIKLRIR